MFGSIDDQELKRETKPDQRSFVNGSLLLVPDQHIPGWQHLLQLLIRDMQLFRIRRWTWKYSNSLARLSLAASLDFSFLSSAALFSCFPDTLPLERLQTSMEPHWASHRATIHILNQRSWGIGITIYCQFLCTGRVLRFEVFNPKIRRRVKHMKFYVFNL